MIEITIALIVIAILATALIIEDIRRWREYLNRVQKRKDDNGD